jgi:haloalkane dehalogenase
MSFVPVHIRGEYPWETRFLDVGNGVRMHFLDEGRGEPLLMLHGNPTWSFAFRHLVRAFSGTHRCVVPDHVGMGFSDRPYDDRYDYRLERRVADVEKLVRYLKLGNDVTIVGHDWGGMIGLAWALRNPERVKRIVLANTSGFPLPAGKRLPFRVAAIRSTRGFPLLGQGLNAFVRGAVRYCSVKKGALTRAAKAGYLAPYGNWHDRIGVQRFVEDIPLSRRDPSWELVEEVAGSLPAICSVPTIVFWGAKDFVFDDDFLAEWRRRVPTAEYHRFADAGHFVLEDAREEVEAKLRRFLAAHKLERAEP